MNELKLCPFCGGPAVILSDEYTANDMTYYFAGCLKCGCRTPQVEEKKRAIKVWNKRVNE